MLPLLKRIDEMIGVLMDLEKDLRECEGALRLGFRRVNCIRDESWFSLMEEHGFLVEDRFLPIIDIINKTKGMTETVRSFVLESVSSDLSRIASLV